MIYLFTSLTERAETPASKLKKAKTSFHHKRSPSDFKKAEKLLVGWFLQIFLHNKKYYTVYASNTISKTIKESQTKK